MSSKVIQELKFVIKPDERLEFHLERDAFSYYSFAGDIKGRIDWEDTSNIKYYPNKGFKGIVNVELSYIHNNESLSVAITIVVADTFRPRARIIKIIGQELISNDVIALVELIKNSYDADATSVEIQFNNVFKDNGEIIIRDTGNGMSYDKIVNVWLEPATPDKKSANEKTFSLCYKRRLLGEKGIGRFAVHRLGEKIELITRAKINCSDLLPYESKVTINWSEFSDDKYLSDIPVNVDIVESPEEFQFDSGTLIKISGIHPWKNIKTIRDAVTKIRSLESPVDSQNVQIHDVETNLRDPGFKVRITSDDNEVNKAIKETKTLKDLLDTAFYSFQGKIDNNGHLIYDYSFNRPDLQDLKRTVLQLENYLPANTPEWFEENPINSITQPGQFEVNFYAWDLDTPTLRIANLAEYYRNIIKPNAGVRVYRDNFRVWPYGEPDDDWLGLDLKRLNTPRDRSVSRNQVFGVIHISSISNPELQDQSNREGFIVNEQYEQFYQLVQSALTVFAKERKIDKIKIDKVRKTSSVNDIVTTSIDNLKGNIEKHNHEIYYKEDVDKIEVAYKQRINDVLERYMMAAAIGIAYSMPIHEMKLRLNSIKNIVEDLSESPEMLDKFLKQLSSFVQETEDIVNAVTSMMSRQKKQKVNLFKVAQNVQLLKESDLRKFNIHLRLQGDKDLQVEAVPGLLNTAVLNLVDNAIYWLRSSKLKARSQNRIFEPEILIGISKREDDKIIFQVKDNGDGLEDPFELLIEPYYSRKTDGLGLGLFLVNEIMSRFGGQLYGYNKNGAIFELIF